VDTANAQPAEPAAPPWPPGSATGVGSLPGTDPRAAARLVLDELPDFPHLPELPARGPGADLVGRGCAHLVDLHVDLQPAGWRLVPRPGGDERRARDLLAVDVDAFAEAAAGLATPVKLQVAGPWTLAAALDRPRGGQALADPGAVRDLVDSLTQGLADLLADLRRRLPAARWLVQLDEPALPGVLAGQVATASGFGRVPAVAGADAADTLRRLVRGVAAPVLVHCCAADPPVDVLRQAGCAAVGVDLTLPGLDEDQVGEAVEAGVGLFCGLLDPLTAPAGSVAETAELPRGMWRRLGLPAGRLATDVVVTPTCGLAGAAPATVGAILRRCRETGRELLEAAA
jgi:hypothetical protein